MSQVPPAKVVPAGTLKAELDGSLIANPLTQPVTGVELGCNIWHICPVPDRIDRIQGGKA
jgi:hypothetical protein